MKNFIDFVVDAAKNHSLGEELAAKIKEADHHKVAEWFKGKGYTVSPDEAKKLVDNKDQVSSARVGLFY